jgi:tight adherence protein C
MNLAALTVGAIVGLGAWLLCLAIIPARPPLGAAINRLHRQPPPPSSGVAGASRVELLGHWVMERIGPQRFARYRSDLAVLDRPVEIFAAQCALAFIAGLTIPGIVAAVLAAVGVTVGVLIPMWIAVVCAAIGPVLVVLRLHDAAEEQRDALRLQLGAFLDVLAMLLAAAEADEQALQLAARSGDGVLFEALTRAFRDAAIAGRPMLTGMDTLGQRWDLPELVAIAAAGSLAATDGAAVRRTLMAKAKAMRATQLAAEETDARLRSSKLALPQFLIAVAFIVLLLYPALIGLLDGLDPTT